MRKGVFAGRSGSAGAAKGVPYTLRRVVRRGRTSVLTGSPGWTSRTPFGRRASARTPVRVIPEIAPGDHGARPRHAYSPGKSRPPAKLIKGVGAGSGTGYRAAYVNGARRRGDTPHGRTRPGAPNRLAPGRDRGSPRKHPRRPPPRVAPEASPAPSTAVTPEASRGASPEAVPAPVPGGIPGSARGGTLEGAVGGLLESAPGGGRGGGLERAVEGLLESAPRSGRGGGLERAVGGLLESAVRGGGGGGRDAVGRVGCGSVTRGR